MGPKPLKIPPTPSVNIIDAVNDPNLFAPWFKDTKTWSAWVSFLKSLFALDMTADEQAVYRQCTGRQPLGARPATEGWLVVGRRGGKSFILALVAVFLACFRDWSPYLSPGERATIIIIATDRRQARVIFRYVLALLQNVPLLAPLIHYQTRELI